MTHTASADPKREAGRKLMTLRILGGAPLTIAIAIPLLSGALLVGQAVLLASVLGRTIQDGHALSSVTPLIAAIAAIIAVRAALSVIGEQAGQIGAERIKQDLRARLFAHTLASRARFGVAPASGAVSAAIVDQVEALENFFARYLPAMIGAGVLPIAFAVILFPIDWVVALLFLFSAPLIPVFMALAGWGAQAATDRQARAFARLSGHFADRLRGLLTLKLFGRAEAATSEVYNASEELRRRTNAVLRIAFLSSAILEFFAALGVAGVALYVGLTYLGFLGINPQLTLTAGFFALLMAPEVYQPLRQLAAHYHDRAAARSAIEEIQARIGEIDALDRPETAGPARPSGKAIAVSIRDLTVVTETGRAILDGLALDLAAGRSLAIMGRSGIGKSTLARAIARLVEASGTITLNGENLVRIGDADLRASLVVIGQKPRIFHGTIAENIALANPAASPAAIAEAARRACVTEFTGALPRGLDTIVGEGGEGLSGGQAHRVALARLFLTDPGLVILDEPTAHLDGDTQARVLDEIFAFAAGRTLIVLTHTDAVAHRAESVMRMAGGKLLATPHRRGGNTRPREQEARA